MSGISEDSTKHTTNSTVDDWSELKRSGYTCDKLTVKESPGKGLGVFAKVDFCESDVIEYCHALVMEFRGNYISDPRLKQYAYWHKCGCDECKNHGARGMILFGCGSIYNSASSAEASNAIFRLFPLKSFAVFIAKRAIRRDEEILTWWGDKYYNFWCSRSANEHTTCKIVDSAPSKIL